MKRPTSLQSSLHVWKVRQGQPGRPVVSREVRDLIRSMCRQNPTWGAPRIHAELLKLGIDISQTSVTKYMVRCHKPPSQTWRAAFPGEAHLTARFHRFLYGPDHSS